MAELNAAKVIRRVRRRMEISQESLSRLLNATKGAVQHWERGRNHPDLARLLALRPHCPPGAERKELDVLIKQTQARVAPLPTGKPGSGAGAQGGVLPAAYLGPGLTLLRRENARMHRQVAKLQATLQRRSEQLRILEGLATDLQREMSELRAGHPGKASPVRGSAPSAAE